MFITNKKYLLSSVGLGVLAPVLTGCDPAPSVALRVDCGGFNNQGTEVRVNGEFKGECPVDVMVAPGMTSIEARKNLEDLSYHYGKDDQQLVADTMRRVNLNLKREYPQEYYYKRATGIEGINEYLEKFPESKHTAELRQKLEDIFYGGATGLIGISVYLNKFPEGKYASELRQKHENIFYQRAIGINGINEYLTNFPEGKHAKELRQKLEDIFYHQASDMKGRLAYLEKYPSGKYANAIRQKNAKALFDAGFIDNNDGTVTALATKLTWQRCSVGQSWSGSTCTGKELEYDWASAMALAKNGWRLPSLAELDALVYCSSAQRVSRRKEGKSGRCLGSYQQPTIISEVFPDAPTGYYWTSSPYAYNSHRDAWLVSFTYGHVDWANKISRVRVRLVRGVQ
jgi:hypothetical protein